MGLKVGWDVPIIQFHPHSEVIYMPLGSCKKLLNDDLRIWKRRWRIVRWWWRWYLYEWNHACRCWTPIDERQLWMLCMTCVLESGISGSYSKLNLARQSKDHSYPVISLSILDLLKLNHNIFISCCSKSIITCPCGSCKKLLNHQKILGFNDKNLGIIMLSLPEIA